MKRFQLNRLDCEKRFNPLGKLVGAFPRCLYRLDCVGRMFASVALCCATRAFVSELLTFDPIAEALSYAQSTVSGIYYVSKPKTNGFFVHTVQDSVLQ